MEERAKYKQGQFIETSFLPALHEMIGAAEAGGASIVRILDFALDGEDAVAIMAGWIGENPVGKLVDHNQYRETIADAIVQFAVAEREFSEHNLYVLRSFDLLDCIDALGRKGIGELTVHEIGDWVVIGADLDGDTVFFSPDLHGATQHDTLEHCLLWQISKRHYATLKLIYENEEKSKR